MRKQDTLRHPFVVVTIVVLLLVIPFGSLCYFYVSRNRDYLTQRNLRLLSVQSNQLQMQIEIYANNVLKNLSEKASRDCQIEKRSCIDALIDQPGQRAEASIQFDESLRNAFRLAPRLRLVGKPDLIYRPEIKVPEVTLTPLMEENVLQLQYDYIAPIKESGWTVKFAAAARIDELIGKLGSEVFDEVLIVSRESPDAAVIYQQNISGPRLLKIGMVKDENGKEVLFRDVMVHPSVYQLNSTGTQYKLFVQPAEYRQMRERSIWSLCGLVRTDRFREESFTVSYTQLLLFIFGFILVMFSSPLIKFMSLGPTDRLGFAHVALVHISILTIVSLITFFLFDLYAYKRLEKQLDAQLDEFSTNIQMRFNDEMKQLAGLIRQVNASIPRDKNGNVDEEQKSQTSILRDSSSCCRSKEPCNCPGWVPDGAPYFDIVTLIRAGDKGPGKQIGKWTIEQVSTTSIDVSKRSYFRAIKQGTGWKRNLDGREFTFFIEPVFSLNTGEAIAVMSAPGPPAQLDRNSPLEWVTMVTTKLISLRNTVVPPGFGYAVVDQDGKALFHFKSVRVLSENFIDECDNDRELRAMLLTRGQGSINAVYRGREHRLRLTPFAGLPWTLIVFRDKEVMRTANLELLSAALILSVICGVVFVLPVLLFCLRQPNFFWPHKNLLARYRRLLAANLGLIILLLIEFSLANHHHIPLLAFIVPPFALLLSRLKLSAEDRPWPWRQYGFFALLILLPVLLLVVGWHDSGNWGIMRRWWFSAALALYGIALFALPEHLVGKAIGNKIMGLFKIPPLWQKNITATYISLGVSLVIIISVLPSAVFFRLAHDAEMEILVKHGQFSLSRALADREQKIKSEYAGVDLPEGYLTKRIENEGDIYCDFFFKTKLGRGERNFELSAGGPQEALFDVVMEKIRPLYNDISVQTRTFVHDTSGDREFLWKAQDGRITRTGMQPGTHFYPLSSTVPLFTWPGSYGWRLVIVLAGVSFLAAICAIVRFAAMKIFLLNQFDTVTPHRGILGPGKITRNTLILGRAESVLAKQQEPPDCYTIDIRAIAIDGSWKKYFEEDFPENTKVVMIDHLEYEMENGECNTLKLRLMERCLQDNRTLLVRSGADPMSFPLAPMCKPESKAPDSKTEEVSGEKEERNLVVALLSKRWTSVWSTFRRVDGDSEEDFTAELENLNKASQPPMGEKTAGKLKSECTSRKQLCQIGVEVAGLPDLTPERVVPEVLDRARAYYRALWATCSQEEKIALFHLAQDGFVHATFPVLRDLLQRGLLVVGLSERNPQLSLFNDSFRKFVLEMDPSVRAISGKKESSPWAVVRSTLIVALIGVALIVFLSQPQLLNAWTAFIGAASAGIPALLKLFGLIRGANTQT
jgi:hypothetical protein